MCSNWSLRVGVNYIGYYDILSFDIINMIFARLKRGRPTPGFSIFISLFARLLVRLCVCAFVHLFARSSPLYQNVVPTHSLRDKGTKGQRDKDTKGQRDKGIKGQRD